MKQPTRLGICVALFTLLMSAHAQTSSTQVEGRVSDGAKPLAGVSVTLTNLATARVFKVRTDTSGKFLLIGMPYGDYQIEIVNAAGENLYKQKQPVAPYASGPAVLVIDVSQRKGAGMQSASGQAEQSGAGAAGSGQQSKYTKEQIEEIKRLNEKALNINQLIKQANDAMAAKNWQDALGPLDQLIAVEPSNWQYYSSLGDAQLNLGQYPQAIESYQKGIQVLESNTAEDSKGPAADPAKKRAGEARMLTNEGNALLKLHKNTDALAAYNKAASLDPNPATAYFNICATQYNAGNTEGALEACDKAIAADPNKADAYFIKGSLLIAGGKTDAGGTLIAPPGTAEALNKYLELQPDGPHANDVREMLQAIGSKVETTYHRKAK